MHPAVADIRAILIGQQAVEAPSGAFVRQAEGAVLIDTQPQKTVLRRQAVCALPHDVTRSNALFRRNDPELRIAHGCKLCVDAQRIAVRLVKRGGIDDPAALDGAERIRHLPALAVIEEKGILPFVFALPLGIFCGKVLGEADSKAEGTLLRIGQGLVHPNKHRIALRAGVYRRDVLPQAVHYDLLTDRLRLAEAVVHIPMHLFHGAAADRVVRMVANQLQIGDIAIARADSPAADRMNGGKRLCPALPEILDPVIFLFDVITAGKYIRQEDIRPDIHMRRLRQLPVLCRKLLFLLPKLRDKAVERLKYHRAAVVLGKLTCQPRRHLGNVLMVKRVMQHQIGLVEIRTLTVNLPDCPLKQMGKIPVPAHIIRLRRVAVKGTVTHVLRRTVGNTGRSVR